MTPLFECVPNFSEGRKLEVVDEIERAISSVGEAVILHRTSDADHNRSVFTFAGSADAVVEAAVRSARAARDLIDLNTQSGVHPRVGALDVLPFVPLEGATIAECVDLARRAGKRIWRELGIPVYFYEAAALRPDRTRLEEVRRGEFEGLRDAAPLDHRKAPDLGGPALHPTAGAVIAGARKVLIAYNINLRCKDPAVAKDIAREIRTSSGGLPAVKALGLPLASRGLVQVSMNLTDFELTPVHVVFNEVERLAALRGVQIEESELIGLLPRKAVEAAFSHWLKLPQFESGSVIETRMEKALQLRRREALS